MKTKIAFAIFLFILSCGCMRSGSAPYEVNGEVVQKVEIYSRDFMTLSYLPYTKANLLKHSDKKSSIANLREIRQLVDNLPNKCLKDASVSAEKMNLYVVIIFYGKASRLDEWQFSKFHFYKESSDHPCKMDDAQRMKVEQVIASLK